MIKNVSIPEALEYKKQLEKVKGVTEVTWLDDAVDITVPEDTIDEQTKKIYYVNQTALFNVTIEEDNSVSVGRN